ncbi:MAG: arginase [Elusimicrobia bacterium]|nr:arginase [Elusimicrobiota bacterium]
MTTKKVALIGVPLELGASKRGSAGGPAAIRRTDLEKRLEELGVEVQDRGDVSIPDSEPGSGKMKHAAAIEKVCKALAKETYAALKRGRVPVVLGGDHSLAMGSISGVAKKMRESRKIPGVVWVDAHTDINTPRTSTSGNVHGMPLAHLLGLGSAMFNRLAGFSPALDARRVCLVGIRDVDDGEKRILRETGVRVFTMADIDRQGMARVAEQAIEIATAGDSPLHCSFDIDAADPSIAQGVGTPKRGGLTYREAHLLMEMIAETGRMSSMDLTEVNPLEDSHNTTAELAAELILSALGKRIY